MATQFDNLFREQLRDRRQRLGSALVQDRESAQLRGLLREVDAALERMDQGSFGLCKACHEPIEADRLIADPLMEFCLDHLTAAQQADLQRDLDLAAQIQAGLLPRRDFQAQGWKVAFHYEAAGVVSGDYCDLINGSDGSIYFMLGDVSGKGVAASLLMTHLHAMFRTLLPLGLPLDQVMQRASRVFCESTLPTHFATLVCGRATQCGEMEICNAGHLPPLLVQRGSARSIEGNSLPVGMFCDQAFNSNKILLSPGDTLVIYTDGVSETENDEGIQYGDERLHQLIRRNADHPIERLIAECLREIREYRGTVPKRDDLTVMAIRRFETAQVQ
jgi:phosphoserine phosphatase RsbU/P